MRQGQTCPLYSLIVNSIYNLCKYEKYEDGCHLLEQLALLPGGEAAGHPAQ
jgi:hypothetical protein